MTRQRRRLAGWADQMLAAQKRERDHLLRELATIKGFMPLLMKRRNRQHWTAAERAELTAQLRAMAAVSPYLAVMALPGSFAFLPVVAWWLDRRRLQRTGNAKST